MPEFQAFAALRFASGLYESLPELVAPPSSGLARQATQELRARHSNNICNLVYPESGQTRRGLLEEWLKREVLVSDQSPAFYAYRQEFELGEELHHRTGWFGALELTASDHDGIFAHAHPDPDATEPLERQMRELSAHLEAVTMLTADPQGRLAQLGNFASMGAPVFTFVDRSRVEHTLWRVDDATTLKEVKALVEANPLVILDGHGPFEAALAAAREGIAIPLPVLVLPAHEPALLLFAVHRGLSGLKTDEVMARLEGHFEITRWTRTLPELLTYLSGESQQFAFGMGLGRGFYLVTGEPAPANQLDVVTLHELVLEGLLELEPRDLTPGGRLTYFDDPDSAHDMLDREELKVAFFLRPPQVEQIMASTLAGKRLPRRSLTLYPRTPMGLVMTSSNSLQAAGSKLEPK